MKHQQIIDAIKGRMQEIYITDGYYTDLGSKVYVNKPNKLISAVDDLGLNIVEVGMAVAQTIGGGARQFFDFNLLVEITIHMKGANSVEDLREGIWDVMKAIGSDLTWGGLAINTFPPPDNIVDFVFDQEEQIVTGARISFIVMYRESAWHGDESLPWTQS